MLIAYSCNEKIKENKDQVYSRHLQKQIQLTVISTPAPKDRANFNLILLNNSDMLHPFKIPQLLDSLNRKKMIQPLIIVAIEPVDASKQYGLVGVTNPGNDGTMSEKFQNFILNELLPFVKKKAEVRKFNSVSIVGEGNSGISALDIAWNNWDKFNNVVVLNTGKEKVESQYSALINKIKSSRKRPKLNFWLQENQLNNETIKTDSISLKLLADLLQKKGIAMGNIQYFDQKNAGQNSGTSSGSFAEFLIQNFSK